MHIVHTSASEKEMKGRHVKQWKIQACTLSIVSYAWPKASVS